MVPVSYAMPLPPTDIHPEGPSPDGPELATNFHAASGPCGHGPSGSEASQSVTQFIDYDSTRPTPPETATPRRSDAARSAHRVRDL
ncbi:MAG: hypothetical protein RL518_1313 [Pseudomonadota bacterium]